MTNLLNCWNDSKSISSGVGGGKSAAELMIEENKQQCILFANLLRVNFNNSLEEVDNYCEDIFYTVDKKTQKNYTTDELYSWWLSNII